MRTKILGGIVAAASFVVPVIACAAGTWTTKAPPSIGGLLNSPSPVVGGKIYLVGALAYPGVTNQPTQIYDPTTDSWATDTSVGNVAGGLSAAINGKIYYVGGCSFSDCNSPTNALRIFDPLTHIWTNGAPMPTARGTIAGGVLNGKLYITTGRTNSSGTVAVNMLQIYDPLTNQWTTGAPLPLATPRDNAVGAVLGGKLFIIGGGWNNGIYDRVDVYDPLTDSWSQEQPLPQPLQSGSGAVLNGRIHVFGGTDAAGNTIATHYVFDPSTHTWTIDAPLPTARSALTGATVGTAIYAIGGTMAGYNYAPVNEVFEETPPAPTNKDQCKKNGWMAFGVFKNQGDCIQYVNTGK